MATTDAVDYQGSSSAACWCCGSVSDPDRMVHLGNHPEVALCLQCARWASKQASAIEDHARTGPMVTVRRQMRAARDLVVRSGWHNSRILGPALRWIGRRWP